MSTYYDLYFVCDLKPDVPNSVIQAIEFALGVEHALTDCPKGFDDSHWKGILDATHEGVMIFPGDSMASLRSAYRGIFPSTDDGGKVYRQTLSFRTETIDDGLDTYLHFLEWLALYIDTQGFIGYLHCEYDKSPMLIYIDSGRLDLVDVNKMKSS